MELDHSTRVSVSYPTRRIRLEGRDPSTLIGRTFLWNLAPEDGWWLAASSLFYLELARHPRHLFFVFFSGTEPSLAAFPKMSETRSSHFVSLIDARQDRLFAVCLSCFSSLESDRLLRDLPPQTGSRSAISLIADEAESIIPGTC